MFECEAIGHACLDVAASGWSVCLWRSGREGARSLTLSQHEAGIGVPESAWPTSTCRRVTLDWIVMPYLAEVPLTRGSQRYSLLVLGRERPFGLEDSRRVDSALRYVALVEHLVLRLEPPNLLVPGAPLTDREREVLRLLADGLLARSIAQRLDVSERTVHKHLGNLYRKLDAHDRLLAVVRGRELGLLPEQEVPRPRAGGW